MTGRPDPDALLAQVEQEERTPGRGWLKIFLGASPGVGKTFTMLESARLLQAAGKDVVVGLVETHGRAETARLLEGLEILPRRDVEYHGVRLTEFDLDAALARKPDVLLLDELAHTNAVGSRHARRWQDAEELLAADIDVHGTLNIQHVESLNDVVAQITGVVVRETVPDALLDRADEIELVDVSADVVIQRLREGKVYLPDQAQRALDRFFRRGNLFALRELALRETARRVDAQLLGYRKARGISDTWPAAERVLVCVGPNPASARLVRAGRRMASALRADWVAAYVQTPAADRQSARDRDAALANLRLAESLGGRAVTLHGHRASDEIIAYARANNVTRLLVGKPTHPRWRDRVFGSLHDALIRGSGDIDVYVITGEEAEPSRERARPAPRPAASLRDVGGAALVILLVTALGLVLRSRLTTIDVAMLYLLGVVVAASRYPQTAAVSASVLGVAAFDFLFVPPYYTFSVTDVRFMLTFLVMLVVAIVMSRLTSRIRRQAILSREREQRTAALFELSRELAAGRSVEELATAVMRHIRLTFGAPAVVALAEGEPATLRPAAGDPAFPFDDPKENAVARWVHEHGQLAGVGTDTLPSTRGLYVPLATSGRTIGVIGLLPDDPEALRDPDRRQLLEAFATQSAVALERALLAARREQDRVEVEAERLRASLLSSLSHDLRTPLAGIEGSATSLLQADAALAPEAQRALLHTIVDESRRMTRLIVNLLDMMRVETGSLQVHKEWQPLEEVVGVVLIRLDQRLAGREVDVRLPDDLPLVPIDGLLMEQVFVNLLENAIKYTPPGSPVTIGALHRRDDVLVEVADRGPGVPAGQEERIFEKFRRLKVADAVGGAGLGLTICRGIVHAHGGRIWADARPDGGTAFRFTIPLHGPPRDAAPPEPEREAAPV